MYRLNSSTFVHKVAKVDKTKCHFFGMVNRGTPTSGKSVEYNVLAL